MAQKEAKARIKINKLLEESGWRFFDDNNGKANITLESNTKIMESHINEMGEDFEKTKDGFIDFLLLDEKGFPLIVLEAKSEDKQPLVGKEQARKYAKSQNCRFVILSNGNLHYFWDLVRGNPYVITKFPDPSSVKGYKDHQPDAGKIVNEPVNDDYIALTQWPNYSEEAAWKNEGERSSFIETNKLRFLRGYQLRAINAIKNVVKEGQDRFLFEMATGTGKTLVAAAVIKLFLRTGNARRVLFLVDRLELEDQANKAFTLLLKNDFKSIIYKENRDDWRKAEIVVTTVQSLLFNNKYRKLFSPTDFDLVISDEAHRSIGGNSRAVFEYFVGYKLGLPATPKDYLKKFDKKTPATRDPREFERRVLMDTYRTFGCEGGQPTFRYSLIDGVKDGFLINPVVVDARTDITTQLLSDEGYSVMVINDEGKDEEQSFYQRDFERKFFSDITNGVFCKTFLENALRDPVSGEIGKSIIFTVSQNHAARITQTLNEIADKMFPGKYNSDFAVQVTSFVTNAQQFSINFTNNNLCGSANFVPVYKTSKARVCVTVGMMTTGYDCPDILNLCLMRPVFSPTDFIQIKGRGTRKHDFLLYLFDEDMKSTVKEPHKSRFKLFDFFANCEYFEEKFNYDEILTLPQSTGTGSGGGTPIVRTGYENFGPDPLAFIKEEKIGYEGMKIDRMFFNSFEEKVKEDEFVKENIKENKWDKVIEYVIANIMDKPEEYYTIEKLRRAAGIDRRLPLREILEKIFGMIPYFKSKNELLDEEFEKFISDLKPEDSSDIIAMKYFFKAYISNNNIRDIIESKRFTELNVNPTFNMKDFKDVPPEWRTKITEYVKDYVPLNQFMT
ncbi:MAG: DEAD/DEAH box helicase family protein [Nitrospirota bacterium]